MGNYQVTILDDGTPQKYLDKIQQDFPKVIIIKSENHQRKNQAIADNLATGKEINGFEIPTELWKNAVRNASEYFIMTEDDVWFTQEINVDELSSTMKQYNMALIKLGWISQRPIKSKIKRIDKTEVFSIKPEVFTAPRFIMDWLFDNKYKLYSLLYRLKLVNTDTKNEYWIMNALLMGFYSKSYWLKVWENIDKKVDETMQIKNAIQWYRKNKHNDYNFGKLEELKMNTTFVSSATNSYHKYGVGCDINMFNHIMNEEWFSGNFNSLQNFPKDIPEDYYYHILKAKNNDRCTPEAWKLWADKFKEQYRKQDVNVD